MTIAADGFDRPDRFGVVRWTGSLLIVLALHTALVLIIMLRQVWIEPVGMPPAAVIIDLAPVPAASPPAPSATLPPEPQVQPQPPETQAEPLPLPQPEAPKLVPSPAPHPAVTLPAPQPPKPKPKVKMIEQPTTPLRSPEPAARAPIATAALPPSSTPPASASHDSVSSSPAASASWQAQLVAWIEKYKRYPRVAQEQRQQGVVYLRFAIDRQGRVLSSHINRSSGFELLDDEVLALIQRAQPMPAPPPEVLGDRIDLVVPVAFSLRR
jgi:periplasmic protein TonB